MHFSLWSIALNSCTEGHKIIQGCWEVLSPTGKETSYSDRRFWFSYILFIIVIGGILVLFIYITRLASKEIFSPSNRIHREVGWAKDLSAPLYYIRVKFLRIAVVNISQLIFVLQFWTGLSSFYRLRSVQTRYGALVSLILNQHWRFFHRTLGRGELKRPRREANHSPRLILKLFLYSSHTFTAWTGTDLRV